MVSNIKSLTVKELVTNFITGHYTRDTTEYLDAGEALHEKLTSMNELVPMLISDNKASQKMATYIAALEGEGACIIFPYVFDLLESPWVEVRDEVCDCFSECATKGEQLVALINHLDDSEQSIRLKVITVLTCLKNSQLDLLSKFVERQSELKWLLPSASLLAKRDGEKKSIETLNNDIVGAGKITQFFIYAFAIREKYSQEILFELSQKSINSDIMKHFNIYYDS